MTSKYLFDHSIYTETLTGSTYVFRIWCHSPYDDGAMLLSHELARVSASKGTATADVQPDAERYEYYTTPERISPADVSLYTESAAIYGRSRMHKGGHTVLNNWWSRR